MKKLLSILVIFSSLLLVTLWLFSCNSNSNGPQLPKLVASQNLFTSTTWYNGSTQVDSVMVSVEGGLEKRVTFSSSETWLGLYTTDTVTPLVMKFLPNSLDLPKGVHTAIIRFWTQGVANSPLEITYQLTIGSSLDLSQTVLHFSGTKAKDSSQSRTVNTSDGSGNTIPITAASPESWLTVSPTTGTTPSTLTIRALYNMAAMPTGISARSITVSSDSALNSPRQVVCSLTVNGWFDQSVAFPLQFGDIAFPTDKDGYILGLINSVTSGFAGYIYKTNDSGTHWEDGALLKNYRLNALDFYDVQTGWIAADSGHILLTSNGGGSWTEKSLNDSINIFDIDFIDNLRGWCAGSSGRIYQSIDGGNGWTPLPSGVTNDLSSMHFIDDSTGFACGSGGIFLRTDDGGQSWDTSHVSLADLRSLSFLSKNLGWMTGDDGLIWRTTNGGTSWTSSNVGFPGQFKVIFFADANHGWAAGTDGTVYGTTNGGLNWAKQYLTGQSGKIFSGITARNAQSAWLGTGNGTILHTLCGGN